MKKTWLAGAGIVSALVLTGMFIFVFVIPVFLSPVIAIDPITDKNLDAHNRLILTGTTTLPAKSFIAIKVDPSSPDPAQKQVSGYSLAQGYVQVIPNTRRNLWKGIVDLSSLPPAEYTMSIVTIEDAENFTQSMSAPVVTRQFTLRNETSGSGTLLKRTVMEQPFIRINNADENRMAGGMITGTTSLDPGTALKWQLDAASPGMMNPQAAAQGVTQVIPGMEGINRWSFAPNLTDFPPAHFRLMVNGGGIGDSAEFNLTPTGTNDAGSGHTPGFITIDSLPDIRQNGVYIITGTTSLPPGDELLFMVLPYSSGTEIDLMIDPVTKAQVSRNPYSGQTGMVEVRQVDETTNFWAFQLETYMMEPGTYAVKMNNDKYDMKTGTLVSRGMNTTRVFTLQEKMS
jgi:hypothetical protein